MELKDDLKFNELEKNSVKATNQLKESDCVRFENLNDSGIRVMFVGNSITLHGYKPEIGWNGFWGMAASSKENDYVHILMNKISKVHSDASYCICQVSNWERKYLEGDSVHNLYESARDFKADVIIMRFIENCPHREFDHESFYTQYGNLIKYLNKTNKAKLIVTTSFWRHPGDDTLVRFASDNGLPLVFLGDLGERVDMKAIGLFEHKGVANHPGDLGMKAIADRIYEVIEKII